MVKRLWPAIGLAGALLLAATSLHATEDSLPGLAVQRFASVDRHIPDPGTRPLATPAIPGDDDMPNRNGRGGIDSRIQIPTSSAGVAPSRGLLDLVAGLRQRWILMLVMFR